MRFFNTAGPVDCSKHYCVPPLNRLNLNEIKELIERERYFVLHAPRQVGKTSYLLALMAYLNENGRYHCLYFNVEAAQAARENVETAMRAILNELGSRAKTMLNDSFAHDIWPDALLRAGEHGALGDVLTRWAAHSEKPLVLLIDEIDSLVGDTLISVLRQLRAGYDKRPALFPQSVVLCGVRDVRDYRIHSSREKAIITGGSAFNVKATSLRMGDFDRSDVESLLRQHTDEIGQPFSDEALALVWELTQGQPWLVNALAYEVCFQMKEARDRSAPITAGLVNEARERIILRRETHLDQLADKLQEPRVRSVIEPILAGQTAPEILPEDDLQYVIDLGLVTRDGQLRIANPIYREVIPRSLTYSTQLTISQEAAWYVRPDGSLDMDRLLAAFQQFYREHSEHWLAGMDYREAGPQLLLQAFLQRIVNSAGRVEREYGLGRRRTDLLIVWPVERGPEDQRGRGSESQRGRGSEAGDPKRLQRVVIELKVLYKSLEATLAEGLAQTWAYMDACGAEQGHLVIFDRAPDKPWEEKIFRRDEQHRGQEIAVWGM